jgi:hypothetical protein
MSLGEVVMAENSMPEKIGTFLVNIGAMKPEQLDEVLLLQKSGDSRIFGEIAISLGYIDDAALSKYVDSRGTAGGPA